MIEQTCLKKMASLDDYRMYYGRGYVPPDQEQYIPAEQKVYYSNLNYQAPILPPPPEDQLAADEGAVLMLRRVNEK